MRLFRSKKTSNVVRASVTHLPRGQYSVITLALGIDSENNGPKQTYKRNNRTIPLKQESCVPYRSSEIRGYTELLGICRLSARLQSSLFSVHFDIICDLLLDKRTTNATGNVFN